MPGATVWRRTRGVVGRRAMSYSALTPRGCSPLCRERCAALPCGVPVAATAGAGEGTRGRQGGGGVMTDAHWFEGARLNFAHNLMPPPTDGEVRFAWLPLIRVHSRVSPARKAQDSGTGGSWVLLASTLI